MKPQRGFTLIELLIALGVMAVFALLAYRGLDSVLRLHQGAYAHEQQAQAIDRVITQLEADVRQASAVAVIAPGQAGGALRLQLKRRIDSAAGSELATVEWLIENAVLLRRTTLAAGDQSAELLSQVTASAWLTLASPSATPNIPPNTAPAGTAGVQWQPIALEQVLVQPNKRLALQRGLGLRLTVAGKSLEKLFLVGR